jgi:hypothetical protein
LHPTNAIKIDMLRIASTRDYSSLPIYDYATANEELSQEEMKLNYPCCTKNICGECLYSYAKSSGNGANCPYCKAEGMGKTKEESVQDEACGGK